MLECEKTEKIPIELIRDPKIALRPVRKNTLEYLAFRDSVRAKGLLNSIAVRPVVPPNYEVIDGFYRLTICRELGRKAVPCIVRDATDEEVLTLQIVANAVRPETRPVEFARQLKRVQEAIPGIDLPTLAVKVNKTAQWVRSQLGLLNLVPEAAGRVDRGEMPLQSAYLLAKVPQHKQLNLVEDAVRLSVKDFKGLAESVIRQWMEAAKQGRMAAYYDRQAHATQPYMRSLKETLEEIRARKLAASVLSAEGVLTLIDAFYAGLRWASHLDKASVDRLHQQAEERVTKHLQHADVLKTLKKGGKP